MKNYTSLQKSIDIVVGKIGLEKTIQLLDSFINNISVTHSEKEKVQLLTQYLVGIAIRVFSLEEELFYVSSSREYRDARMCCFHLLRKYTEDTLPQIGLAFRCSERSVEYGYGKAVERLALPQGNPIFVSSYSVMETKLVEFIGKIN